MPFPLTPPDAGEYAPFYSRYIATVLGADLRQVLATQPDTLRAACAGLSEAGALHRYAEGKWSVKEVVGHIADAERIFSYRALRIARRDATALSAFDENAYVAAAHFDRRPLGDLVDDFETVRRQTLSLLAGLDSERWEEIGTASGHPVSTRALLHITAGHARHHLRLLATSYGLSVAAIEMDSGDIPPPPLAASG
jgi:uncharacterized damage-inducible protein DinB